jgi:SAM-dependent MidA family methyltransferase
VSTLPPVNSGREPLTRQNSTITKTAKSIVEKIRRDGAMTFRDFMEAALYTPGTGYYARRRTAWNGAGDYVTGPQVHAAFGAAVADFMAEADAAIGSPATFDLVEVGGGDGALLADLCEVLRAHSPDVYERLRVWSVEVGAGSRAAQRRRLVAHVDRVTWLGAVDALPGGLRGAVVSNELLDAFPVHRVVWRDGELRELWVGVEEELLVEREGPLSSERLDEYLELNGVRLREGQRAEICLAVEPWLTTVATRLAAGYLLTIDYGADSEVLYGAGRPQGSLVCQHRYQLAGDPFIRVGEQDITAHVDFGNLRRLGAACGLETVGECSLAVFLVGFGAARGAMMPEAAGAGAVQRYLGLRHLLFTEIGDAHRVVLQAKNVAGALRFGRQRLA